MTHSDTVSFVKGSTFTGCNNRMSSVSETKQFQTSTSICFPSRSKYSKYQIIRLISALSIICDYFALCQYLM